MRAVLIQKQGSPVAPNIVTTESFETDTTPAPGEALIRTECSALNHMDLWVGMGIPGVDLTYPRVSGCDACGRIEAVGDAIDESWIGRRVIVNAAVAQPVPLLPDDPPATTLAPDYHLIGEHTNGMHSAAFTVPLANVATIGNDVDPAAAAAFGLVSLTAWSMMLTKGNLRPGQSVLITGIGGGVSTAALTIAKWLGCPAIVTSRHQWKLDRASELGADHTILDTGEDWSTRVRQITSGRGVDMAVDSVGKPTHLTCIKSLARGGTYVTCGNTGGPKAQINLAYIFWNQLRILGSTMGTTDELKQLAALFTAGHLTPVIDSVHPWTDAQTAWQRLESQDQFGKIVLDWAR